MLADVWKIFKPVLISIFAALLILLVILPAAVRLISTRYFTNARKYESHWKIELPKGSEERFHADTRGFDGDGVQYTIFTAETANDFLRGFSPAANAALEETFRTVLTGEGINPADFPDFTAGYAWSSKARNGKQLLLVYGQSELYCLIIPSQPPTTETRRMACIVKNW